MSFSELILTLVDKRHLAFEIKHAPEAVALREDWLKQTMPLDHVANVSLLQNGHGLVIAIYPMTHQLNLQQVRSAMNNRALRFVDTEQVANKFISLLKRPDFQPSAENDIHIIIDEAITNLDAVYFEAPRPCTLLMVKTELLGSLADSVRLGSRFSEIREDIEQSRRKLTEQAAIDLKQRIAKMDRLPAMPDMPAKLLALRNNPASTVDDMVAIIENDPSLTAQILRYSSSAIYSHHAQAVSLKDAIFRVMGYETVLHLSLGYALGRVFKLPEKGPLGNEFFWQHASFSAALAQQLSQAMPRARRPKPGMAYLAGLLHDIGFLVLNMFFRNEYAWLNKILLANPAQSVVDVEQRLLGVTHNELGAWLLRAWNIPPELLCAVEHHHNLNHTGPYAEYAHLLNLTERLLKMHGMSDAASDEIPPELLTKLGLDEEEVYVIMDSVLQAGGTFKEMARAVSV